MSQKTVSPVHIEWTPGFVRAVNIATGQTAEAESIANLGSILSGQTQPIVGVGHNHIFLKSLRLPRASDQDTRNILGVQIGQLFPLPPEQLSFDFVRTEDQNADGWLAVVGAIRSTDLRQIRAELKPLGLTPLRIMPLALASSAVAARAGQTDALVIDHGRAGLSLDVVQGGVLRFRRVAPFGSEPQAEAQRTLAAARADGLALVTVGSVALPNAIPSLDTALGVLHEAPPFNFELAEERLRERQQKIAARTRLAVLMTVSALLLVLLVWVDRQQAAATVKHSQGVWARQLTTLESIQNADVADAGKATALQNTLRRAFRPAQPLSDIGAVVDDSLAPGAWLTGLTLERGRPLDIRGMAKTPGDVTQFVGALSASPRFRDVRLVFANSATVGKTAVVQFNISAVCVGNLPMPAPETATQARTLSTSTPSTSTASGTGVGG